MKLILTPDVCMSCKRRPVNRERSRSRCTECLDDCRRHALALEERRRALRVEVIDAYGGVCVCCQNDLLVHLTLDHVNNDGSVERKTMKSREIYAKAKREGFPPTYQVMCRNCNYAKWALGRCPCQD